MIICMRGRFDDSNVHVLPKDNEIEWVMTPLSKATRARNGFNTRRGRKGGNNVRWGCLWLWIRVDACICTSARAKAVEPYCPEPSEVALAWSGQFPSSGDSPIHLHFLAPPLFSPIHFHLPLAFLWQRTHSLFVARGRGTE